jgi:hypothetical protein
VTAGSELRARVSAAGRSLRLDRAELVRTLAPSDERLNPDDSFEPLTGDELATERARAAQAGLRRHGLATTPSLPHADGPVEVRATHRYAIQGAIVPAAVLAIAAAAGYWLYGAAFAAAGAIAAWLLMRQWELVDRALPVFIPRGYILGAVVVAPLILIAGLAVVLPVRAHRTHAGQVSSAQSILQAARDAVARHDFAAAYAYLDVAASRPLNQGVVADVRAQAVAAQVQASLDEQDRKAGIFDQADIAERRGRLRAALKLFKSIPGFRNADLRAKDLARRIESGSH